MDTKDLKENITKQLIMNKELCEELKRNGLEPGTEVRLDFFYFAPNKQEALRLKNYLFQETDYDLNITSQGFLRKQWGIDGTTQLTTISLDKVNDWVMWMCNAGAQFDCKFDGWGTQLP